MLPRCARPSKVGGVACAERQHSALSVLAVDIEEYFEIEEEERRQNEQASWDWDEVMKRMEELEAAEERGGDEEDEEKPAAESPEQQAAELKAKGNDAFARRKFKDAVKFYSQAIELDPVSHVRGLFNCRCCVLSERAHAALLATNAVQVLYGNRSAAYHRFKKYEDALKDANTAIELDDTWVKVSASRPTLNMSICS